VPTINRHALVPYSAAEMFALVDDVEAYPQFLPWCRSAAILSRDGDEVRATVELAKGAIHKSFTTLNRLQHDKMIEIRLIKGPFHHLHGFWRFDGLGNESESACKVTLDLEYEFSSSLLAMTVGPVFNQVANKLVDAFCQRAETVYGKR
jgi:ribosome-associated toxin RatA of RatAB toxin-antitoxin module